MTPMLNYIWFGLMAIALVVAAFNGTADAVTRGAVESAAAAVQIAIGLVGIMALWLGIMRIAEAAGLVSLLGRLLRPFVRWLFPDVPPGHPAAGSLVLAVAANVLGLNNAATPLGIKAMEELQTLNVDKDSASNAQVTFMAIITSGVQLIPATMIGVLAAAGAVVPTAIIAPSLLATAAGTAAAVLTAKLLQRLSTATARGGLRDGCTLMRELLDAISLWAIPVLLVVIPLAGLLRKVKVYDVFIEGAKEGFDVAVRIIPFLVGILVAIGMFRGSGAMDLLDRVAPPVDDVNRVSGGARTARDPPVPQRQRLACRCHRSRQDTRTGLAHRPHGSDDVRVVGDDLLRAGGVLRSRGRTTHEARGGRGARRRPRRGGRRGRGLCVDVLTRGGLKSSDEGLPPT